ncbi:MAG: hypothetical protein IPH60_14865 [Flavobacteriales bacterium]|nr:hypothetical protein [Flavobacteriales bacterium]
MADEQGSADEEEDGEEDAPKAKAIPEKKRKKLLDAKTWERDLRLADIGGQLLKRFGNKEFSDRRTGRGVGRCREGTETQL